MLQASDPGVSIRAVGLNLALAAIYFAAAKLGLAMAFEAAQVTVVWPPTGIALAALILFGYRLWPGIVLGAFIANLTTNEPVVVALGVAAGNTLEALSAAWMLRRVGFDPRLSRLRDVLHLIAFSALLSTMISATIGVTSLCLGGVQPWDSYLLLWRLWWLGDATGALMIAPALLVWSSARYVFGSRRHLAEALAFLAGLQLVCLSLLADFPIGMGSHPFLYGIFPFVIWAALRFGQHGVTAFTLFAAAFVITATLNGLGPFSGMSADQNLILLQGFMGVIAVTGLLLGAAITGRKQADEALRSIQEQLQTVTDTMEAAVTRCSRDQRYIWVSPGYARLFGHSSAEIAGQPIAKVVGAEAYATIRPYIERVLRGEKVEYETLVNFKNGGPRWISANYRPTYNSTESDNSTESEPTGWVAVIIDITARKQLEEALVQADHRKDEFLAMLAHELRNPLAPITNAVRILERPGIDGTRHQEACDIIAHQVRHMVHLVDDLLDVSRISHGKIVLRQERVLLADTLRSAVETARPMIESCGHAFQMELPQEPLWLEADPIRLSQIFANLLNNAAKYTPSGGEIRLLTEAKNDSITVRVRDNGIGIPEPMQCKVFELFTQVDSSIERAHGGLGIGLTLVKNLVEMHGGRVQAVSEGPGRGSEFIVQLPRAASRRTEREAVAVESRSSSRVFRVLVVDDSEALARTFSWMLEALGHKVRLAYDAKSAITRAREFRPEVVMLDIGLPGMNGYDLCRQLRAEPALKRSIFIAQTGWGQPEHRRRAKAAGFDYHLVKPVDITMLEELLAALDRQPEAA